MINHNEIYEELQNNYFIALRENNKKDIDFNLSQMYLIAKEAARNYIQKYCRKKGLTLDVEEKAHDASIFLIQQHLRKGLEWKVEKLSGAIYFGCLKVLFNDKEWEMKECSYEQYIENEYDN